MKIEKLQIEGYRGFKDKVEIDLDAQVNVFVGSNGSGKTTVLDAIGVLLEMYVGYLLQQAISKYANALNEEDINTKSNLALIQLNVNSGERWSIFRHRQELNIPIDDELTKEIHKTRKHTSEKAQELLYSIPDMGRVPILAYYSTNRLFTGENNNRRNSKKKKYAYTVLECYENALDSKINSFEAFKKWFIENENSENRERIKEGKFDYRNPDLENIRDAIIKFFNSIDSGLPYNRLYVDEVFNNSRTYKEATIFIKKDGDKLRLDKLSDGEKTIILLVSDIARRLTIAHSKPEIDNPLEGKGIVLIDEIELHLHPTWQRKVVPALTKVFPNLQFIITTHSPQVLSNLKRENIHVIEDFQLVKELSPVYGEDSNSILWDIFGVKKQPEHAEVAFKMFYRLLESDDKDLAYKSYFDLVKAYGEEHSEVKKAKLDFDFEFGEYSD